MREGMLGDGSSPPLNPSECELKQEKLGMGWDGWCEGTQETWCPMRDVWNLFLFLSNK